MRRFQIICAGLVLLSGADQARAAPSAARGKEIFRRVGCFECHNYQGQGGVGPRLAKTLPFESLKSYVRSANGNMPPYAPAVLTDEELADIHAYLQSVPAAPSPDSIPAVRNLKPGPR